MVAPNVALLSLRFNAFDQCGDTRGDEVPGDVEVVTDGGTTSLAIFYEASS
jgi:hypothetical protein